MTVFAYIALFGWIPAVLLLFAAMPSRRAVVASFMLAWLFLPMMSVPLPGLPDFSKMAATSYGVLLGTLIFDSDRFATFRPRWVDIPMAVWCVVPFFSSIANGLGWYDGLSTTLSQAVLWGMPYFIGRLYFRELADFRDLAVVVFVGGLIYVPLCLWEIKMSPRLHQDVYGFLQHSWGQTKRGGGWRPMVFMQHGLMVGMWMASATLVGFWLLRARVVRVVWDFPAWMLVLGLGVTAVLCKSTGATMLLLAGVGALVISTWMRRAWIVVLLMLFPVAWFAFRTTGLWTGETARRWSAETLGDQREGSLAVRLRSEDILIRHAMKRPAFGWGGHGRLQLATDDEGRRAVPDGMWVISFGKHGLVGLVSWGLVMVLPMFLLVRRYPAHLWLHPAVAPAAAIGMVLAVYAIDCLFNAMMNPVFVLAAGGIAALATERPALRQAAPSRRSQRRPTPAFVHAVVTANAPSQRREVGA